MSFSATNSEPAIQALNLGKSYQLYQHPSDRLKQFLWPHRWLGSRQYYRELRALHDINLRIMPGEVVGIVGQNGSGKSTLLQLICGTLTPTQGDVRINGRIAALLELGAGFNPEFTGRENIYMSAAILGLSSAEIADRIESIIDFSGVRDFIDQPVKTYSSGMYVRLAFSVAINVNPDILVIDEALSVGDGAFARKSFSRIMQMRDAGKTILFCSHSLFQVESLCSRAVWINQGKIILDGESARVASAYQAFLDRSMLDTKIHTASIIDDSTLSPSPDAQFATGSAHLKSIKIWIDGKNHQETVIINNQSNLVIQVIFSSDPALPQPNVAITLHATDGRIITSAATWEDDIIPQRKADGVGEICLRINQLPLLKGEYLVSAHLLCERGLHIYDSANDIATLSVQQKGRLQGYFFIAHTWEDSIKNISTTIDSA